VLQSGLLTLSPTLHREVLEELADGVVIVDGEGHVVDVNPAARGMVSPGQGGDMAPALEGLLGREWLRDVETRPGCREVAIGGRSYDVRATVVDAGGTGNSRRTVLVFRDITERLQAETELRHVKQEMEHLAHTDALTELPNRRYFMRRLQEEAARLKRNGRDLSVILLDLDHFKEVNDTYGHETGDEVLRGVARIICQCIRGCDVAARLGGEEFALLLPETPLEDACRVGERIRAAIEAHVVTVHPKGSFSITASAGVATAGTGGRWDPLKRADRALYRAKDAGRNAVCS
jgi:diguanylate cyclase (GGDEF)-like protein